MNIALKEKWLDFQLSYATSELNYQNYDNPEQKSSVKDAVILWRFSKEVLNKLFPKEKNEFLNLQLDSKNEYVILVSKMELLPDKIFCKIRWRENVDYLDFESCLRRLTHEQKIAIHENWSALYKEKKTPPVLLKTIIDWILVMIGFYTYEKIIKLSNINEDENRYSTKGAWIYNLAYLDFGFGMYHKGILCDDKLLHKSPFDFFLNKKSKNEEFDTDFYVNMDDGIYYGFYCFTRSWIWFKPLLVKNYKITWQRAICPGFWVTLLVSFEFFFAPIIGLIGTPSNLIAYVILWLIYGLLTMVFITRILFDKVKVSFDEKVFFWYSVYPILFFLLFYAYPHASQILLVVTSLPTILWLITGSIILLFLACKRIYLTQTDTVKSLGMMIASVISLIFILAVAHIIMDMYQYILTQITEVLPRIQLYVGIGGLCALLYSILAESVKNFDNYASREHWFAKSLLWTIAGQVLLIMIRFYQDIIEFFTSAKDFAVDTTKTVAVAGSSTVSYASDNSFGLLVGLAVIASISTIWYVITNYQKEDLLYKNRFYLLAIIFVSNSIILYASAESLMLSLTTATSFSVLMLSSLSIFVVLSLFRFNKKTIDKRMKITKWQNERLYRSDGIGFAINRYANNMLMKMENEVVVSTIEQIYSHIRRYVGNKKFNAQLLKLATIHYNEKMLESFEKLNNNSSDENLYHDEARFEVVRAIIAGDSYTEALQKGKRIETVMNDASKKKWLEERDKVSNFDKFITWITSISLFRSFVRILSLCWNAATYVCKSFWKVVSLLFGVTISSPLKTIYNFIIGGAVIVKEISEKCPMTAPPSEAN